MGSAFIRDSWITFTLVAGLTGVLWIHLSQISLAKFFSPEKSSDKDKHVAKLELFLLMVGSGAGEEKTPAGRHLTLWQEEKIFT